MKPVHKTPSNLCHFFYYSHAEGKHEVQHIFFPTLKAVATISCVDIDLLRCARFSEKEPEGTDSTVYSTAVALAVMGCFQVYHKGNAVT